MALHPLPFLGHYVSVQRTCASSRGWTRCDARAGTVFSSAESQGKGPRCAEPTRPSRGSCGWAARRCIRATSSQQAVRDAEWALRTRGPARATLVLPYYRVKAIHDKLRGAACGQIRGLSATRGPDLGGMQRALSARPSVRYLRPVRPRAPAGRNVGRKPPIAAALIVVRWCTTPPATRPSRARERPSRRRRPPPYQRAAGRPASRRGSPLGQSPTRRRKCAWRS